MHDFKMISQAYGYGMSRTVKADRKEENLQVRIPAPVKRQLIMRAAMDGDTLRATVLKALRDYGIKVSETDIMDRRKDR